MPRVFYDLSNKDVSADGKPAYLLKVSLRPRFYFTWKMWKAWDFVLDGF